MMPLELAISFVLPPQVGFGVAGAGEVQKGKQSKNIRFRIKILCVGKALHVFL